MFEGDPVGPLGLAEHLLYFGVLSLFCFLVYSGLRVDSVARACRNGVVRWIKFVVGVAILAAMSVTASHYL